MTKRHYMGRESIPVTHHFTEEDMKGFANEMAAGLDMAETIEFEKKSANEDFKERLAKAESQAAIAAKKYRTGKEEVYVHCNKVADYDAGEIMWLDPDSGEIVQRRVMTDEERKIPLIMEPVPPRDETHPPLKILGTDKKRAQ